MRKTYSLTANKRPGNVVIFGYDVKIETLLEMRFNESCDEKFKHDICTHVPEKMHWLNSQYFQGCTVKDITDIDTSFEAFWNKYAYKIGNKGRVTKKWNALSEEEKILALHGIPAYRKFTDKKRIQMCFPEMYINGRRWEDEY